MLGFACLLILCRFVYCLVVSYIVLLVVFTYINMLFMILCFQMIRVFLLFFLCSMAAMCSAQLPWLCRDCVVNGTRYRGNHAFQYNRECNQYTCKCLCDGTYDCPPALTKDLCRRVETGKGCSVCEVEDTIYAPGRFRFAFACYLYDCDCNCDGSWQCPAERTINLCWYIKLNPNKR